MVRSGNRSGPPERQSRAAQPCDDLSCDAGRNVEKTNRTKTNGWRRRESAHEHRRVETFPSIAAWRQSRPHRPAGGSAPVPASPAIPFAIVDTGEPTLLYRLVRVSVAHRDDARFHARVPFPSRSELPLERREEGSMPR